MKSTLSTDWCITQCTAINRKEIKQRNSRSYSTQRKTTKITFDWGKTARSLPHIHCKELKMKKKNKKKKKKIYFANHQQTWNHVNINKTTKRSERRKHCARAGCSKVQTPPARPLSQTHRQDRLQYTTPQLASAQCNNRKNVVFPFVGLPASRISQRNSRQILM